MPLPRWLQKPFNLNLDFWLLLPTLALTFWIGGKFVSNRVLSRPYDVVGELEADRSTEIRLSFTVKEIQVLIDQNKGLTEVEVKTDDSQLKKLEFEFPTTEFEQIEKAIARELGLSRDNVKKLARYQLDN
jgi:hypothetical protein